MKNNKYIVSWSGGKDCMLALHKSFKEMGEPELLFSSVPANESNTLAHGYRENILKAQAKALELPIHFLFFEKTTYRQQFLKSIIKLRLEKGITKMVFGDLYLNEHKDWLEKVCSEAGIEAVFPYWIKPSKAISLAKKYIDLGFKSIIVHSRKPYPGQDWVGTTFNESFIEFAKNRFCPMGENGEFHSLVIDGPLFKTKLTPVANGITECEKGFTLNIRDLLTL